jgi:hypothetical protein
MAYRTFARDHRQYVKINATVHAEILDQLLTGTGHGCLLPFAALRCDSQVCGETFHNARRPTHIPNEIPNEAEEARWRATI